MDSPHPADRFTDKEEEAFYEAGYKALKKHVAIIGKAK